MSGMDAPAPADEAEKAFLRACQRGELAEIKAMHAGRPTLVNARSTSKGYGGLHYAAMAGHIAVCEYLHDTLRMDAEAEGLDGNTPIQVALSYKKMDTVRRLQQLRDQRRKDPDGSIAAAAAAAKAKAEAEEAHANAKATGIPTQVVTAKFFEPTGECYRDMTRWIEDGVLTYHFSKEIEAYEVGAMDDGRGS